MPPRPASSSRGAAAFSSVYANAKLLTPGKVVSVQLLAASVDSWVFVADRKYKVVKIQEIHSVVGGAAAAARFRKITDTSAPGAAASATVVELQTAAFDLTATINTTQTATLAAAAADLTILAGQKIALDVSGTLTGLVGTATITLEAVD